MKLAHSLGSARNAGFTLVEVAVTIVIVGITLVASLQVLQGAKLTAAQTRNEKQAREFALYTLGRVESGLYWEDVSDLRVDGTYADEGQPLFTFEVVMGDETFRERDEFGRVNFDNWRQNAADKKAKESETEAAADDEQPYEKVQIKVLFPKVGEREAGFGPGFMAGDVEQLHGQCGPRAAVRGEGKRVVPGRQMPPGWFIESARP